MINYKQMAEDIMFSKATELQLMNKYNVSYRSKKGLEDIKKAIEKALKNGNGKTEVELSFLELHISQIFKETKWKHYYYQHY